MCLAHSEHRRVSHHGSRPSQTPGLASLQAPTPLPAGPSGDTPKFKSCGFMSVSHRPQEADSCLACSQRRHDAPTRLPGGPSPWEVLLGSPWAECLVPKHAPRGARNELRTLPLPPGGQRRPDSSLLGQSQPNRSGGGRQREGGGRREEPVAGTFPTRPRPERSSLGAEEAAACVREPCRPQVSPWATHHTMLPPRLRVTS